MFNKQNNGTDKDAVNVNTRGIQFYNKESEEPSTLVLGFWNERLSLKIHPAKPNTKAETSTTYDYDNGLATALNDEKSYMLMKGIEDIIIPSLKDGVSKTVGVVVNNSSVIAVGSGDDGKTPFISIYRELDPDTYKPKDSMTYYFRKSDFLKDYAATSGEFNITEMNDVELSLFVEFLKSYISGNSNATLHTVRFADKYFRDKIMNNFVDIGNKVGVDLSSTNSKFKANKSSGNIFTGNKVTQSTQPTKNPDVVEVDENEDELPF